MKSPLRQWFTIALFKDIPSMTNRVRKKRGKVLASAPTADPPAASPACPPAGNPLISDAKLKQLYTKMLQCRILDQRVRELGLSSPRAPRHIGGEAVAVGTALNLRRDDWLAPWGADVLGNFLKGTPLATIFSELLAGPASKVSGSKTPIVADPRKYPPWFRLISGAANPAAQLHLAAGVALALQASSKGNVVMSFCGDTSKPGQRWYEALTFAARHCLPLLVVAEIKTSANAASARKKNTFAALMGQGHRCELPVIPVDAEDVVAIYRVAYESIHKARHGGGPTLIQAISFSSSGKSGRAQTRKHPEAVVRMEDYLSAKGLFSQSWKQNLIDAFTREIDSGLPSAKKAPSRNR
jgi:TPP-dependent pyruvate/acetoin dehydrogenase alpha subunit